MVTQIIIHFFGTDLGCLGYLLTWTQTASILHLFDGACFFHNFTLQYLGRARQTRTINMRRAGSQLWDFRLNFCFQMTFHPAVKVMNNE